MRVSFFANKNKLVIFTNCVNISFAILVFLIGHNNLQLCIRLRFEIDRNNIQSHVENYKFYTN